MRKMSSRVGKERNGGKVLACLEQSAWNVLRAKTPATPGPHRRPVLTCFRKKENSLERVI